MNPRVSVVIPAYNNAHYIARTLESVLDQSYEDYEVIIADHCSIDGTEKIIDEFKNYPKLTILSPTPSGGGAVANWNRVSQAATGDFIKLVCGDDLLEATILEEQVKAFDEYPTAAMVASTRSMIDAEDVIVIKKRGLPFMEGLFSGKEALRKTVLSGTNIFGEPACVMMKRDLLQAVGWWDAAHPYYIDAGTYAHLLVKGDLVALQEPLASFRLSASQWSVRLANQQAQQAAAFHRKAQQLAPEFISNMDIRVGNAKAQAFSFARRIIYLLLSRRMGKKHVVESTT